jgi:transposase InsO family protein
VARLMLAADGGVRSEGCIAQNLLDRQFKATAPNQRWVADFTYIWTSEGWLYFAVVLDQFSRRIVGWSMSVEMNAQLVTDALIMAIWRRGKPKALLHHSDRGNQYTSEKSQRLLAEQGITCSMSKSGDVWDNSAMGELLLQPEDREGASQALSDSGTGQGRSVRLRGALLQSVSAALHNRIRQSGRVRKSCRPTLGWC